LRILADRLNRWKHLSTARGPRSGSLAFLFLHLYNCRDRMAIILFNAGVSWINGNE
jgi:hypothetical protein